jgi:cytochrome b
MVYALWGSLVLVIATGLIMTEGKSPVTIADERAAVAQGDWSVLIEPDGDGDHEDAEGFGEIAEEVHEVMSNLMLMLALLHVAGVVVEGRVLGRNLVKPMIRGTRP